jgi:hypothetical protein
MKLGIWGEFSIFYFDGCIITNFKKVGGGGGGGLHFDRNFEVNVGRAA